MTKVCIYGGEGGIRTHDAIANIHAFQACSLNHSDTFPNKKRLQKLKNLKMNALYSVLNFGGGNRDRTDDLLRARQTLSQLSYTPKKGEI